MFVVPLSAIAAAWLRPGAARIRALRETQVGPHLPLLMAVTLFGLGAYLYMSWSLPDDSFGPDQFVVARWFGTLFLAALTIFWFPLFPRVIALLAGIIVGPAVFAGVGYLFFESFLTQRPPIGAVSECFLDLLLVPAALIAVGNAGIISLSGGRRQWGAVLYLALIGWAVVERLDWGMLLGMLTAPLLLALLIIVVCSSSF